MSVKISELPILDSLADNDVIAGVDTSANVTSKIEMATLKNYIDTNTQYTAGTNIDITNNVISAPFVYDRTQTNALIEDLETSVNEQLEEKDERIEELQNEVDSLSMIYNAFPTESGEGESLTLDDTAEVKFKKFGLKGNTSQTTYSGINLFQMPSSATSNGITYKLNDDGTFNISGTATATADFVNSVNIEEANIINGETYTLYFNAVLNFSAMVAFYNGSTWLSTPLTIPSNGRISSATLTIPSECNKINFLFRVNNGLTVNQNNAYCMLVKGSYTLSNLPSFEPYVGGTASPNPSYPQPVNVVSGDNEINVCGKNLFDSSTFSLKTYSGANNSARCSQSQPVPLKAGRYVFTTNLDLSVYDYKCDVLAEPPHTVSTETYIINSGFITNTNTWTLNLTQAQEGYLGILIRKKDNTNLDLETIKGFQFQLEKTSATSYEPYQGNTYNIDLPVENLFDKSTNIISNKGLTTTGGTFDSDTVSIKDFLEVQPNTTYTYSGYDDTSVRKRVCMYSSNNEASFLQESSGTNATLTFTTTSTTKYIRFQFKTSEINNIQLEKGSKANTYTPYGTTPIELCKIGNYQDYFYKDSGKWYLHKEIGKVVLNGSENWQVHGSIASWFYDDTLQNVRYAPSENLAISNYYVYKSYYPNATTIVNGEFTIGYGTDNIGRVVIKNTDYTTAVQFKTWLSSNNVAIYYILATPTTTEITYQPLIDQLNELEKAMSKDGQTNISQVSNDKPFILDVTAIKSLQSVLDRIELLES